MTEAQQIAAKIEAHRATGGRVWSISGARAAEIGKAWAEGNSLFVMAGRTRAPVCIPANYVTAEGRREWRNVRFA